jgi:hypothetical protein
VPTRQSDAKAIYHDSKAVANWLAQLPLANTGEAGKQVFKSLFEMNRLELDHRKRVEILEQFITLADNLSGNLERNYTHTTFPLTEKSHKIALLTREIVREIAIGYKIAINSLLSQQDMAIDQALLTVCLHRALFYLSLTAYESAVIYEPYPVNVWREIHTIFKFSSRAKLDQTLVKQMLNEQQVESTILQQYKKILLFSLASPYQMRQRDIHDLYQRLLEWVDMSKLAVIPADSQPGDNYFVINLQSDSGPAHVSIYPDQATSQCIALKTETLLAHLNQSDEPQQSGFKPSYNLRSLLSQNWSHAQQRHYVRTQLNFQLQVAVGLPLVHNLIEAGAHRIASQRNSFSGSTPQPKAPQAARPSNMFITGDDAGDEFGGLSLQPQNDLNYQQGIGSAFQAKSPAVNFINRPTPQKTAPPAAEPSLTGSCTTVNESTGGYCIEWSNKLSAGIKVGELIGIQSTASTAEFALAVTKWLKNIPGSNLLAGIQLITHHCHATRVRIGKVLPKHKKPDWYLGLLIPATMTTVESLIMPSDLFEAGAELFMKTTQGAEIKIQLQQLTDSTGLFSQYSIVREPSSAGGSGL